MRSSNDRPRYVLVETDRFEADRSQVNLVFNALLGPTRAEDWTQGLTRTLDDLTRFPGPLSHAIDEDASQMFQREVRRLLYHGPNRRSKHPVRILFTLIPPFEDEPEGETVISLLRLLRSGQSLAPLDDKQQSSG